MTIMAATRWPSNAEMIVDVVELGYIKPTDRVIDLTFGRGKWWTKYRHPGEFWANLDPDMDIDDAVEALDRRKWTCRDFRDLGEMHGLFDVILFDPPYVSMGGRATSGLPDFMDRYGLLNAATTPELLHADNARGLGEAWRICKPGGLVLAKCAPYISSAVRKEGDWWARDAAVEIGFTVEDMLIHLGDARAQPKWTNCPTCKGRPTCRRCGQSFDSEGAGAVPVHSNEFVAVCSGSGLACDTCHGTGGTVRVQKHARNNYSVLFIFRKPRTRKKAK